MSRHRACPAFVAFALVMCALAHGCQSPSSFGSIVSRRGSVGGDAKAAAAPFVLAPGMEVEWHVKTAKETPNLIRSGLSVVGPDGRIELGPYGCCKVGGMNAAQASDALERHLTSYLRHPSVTIVTQPSSGSFTNVAWRPAGSGKGPIQAAAWQAAKEGTPAGDEKDKEKQAETIAPPRMMVPPGQALPANGHGDGPFASAPNECRPILLPAYVIGPTDVLQIESLEKLLTQAIRGPHLVGPDGTVRVGVYGAVPIAGLTIDQAKESIAKVIQARIPGKTLEHVIEGLSVDVLAYNSKVYYIITDGAGQGAQLISLPVTGNDKVLDAFAKINGLPIVASKHRIWVARLSCPGGPQVILPVDWNGITQRGEGATNWQIMPGDRIYVAADPWYTADRTLAKVLAPFERLLGVTLLGSQTVNSIKSGSVGGVR